MQGWEKMGHDIHTAFRTIHNITVMPEWDDERYRADDEYARGIIAEIRYQLHEIEKAMR